MHYFNITSLIRLISITCCSGLFELSLTAQCPTTAASMKGIVSVEESAAPLPDKIKHLLHWKQWMDHCHLVKDSTYARLLHRLGDYYNQSDEQEKGISFTREAIAINSGNHAGAQRAFLVNSYYNLASCYRFLNAYEQSKMYYDSCVALGLQYADKQEIALMACENIAQLFLLTGDYQKSKATSIKSISLAKKLNNRLFEGILRCQQAQAELELKQIPQAEQSIRQALNVFTEQHAAPNYMSSGYAIYAALLNSKGDKKNTVRYYRKAFKINLQQKNWMQCCVNMMDLGSAYSTNMNDLASSLSCYKKGISFIRQTGASYELAGIYNNIGFAYARQKNYPEALKYYQKGLNTLPIRFEDSLIRSNPDANTLKKITNSYFVSTFLSNKGEALLNQYKNEKNNWLLPCALQTFEAADKTIDQMRCQQYNETSKLFWREKTKKMYENAIEVCYLLNNVEKAFYFFEKSRAVLLNDKLFELGAKKFLPGREVQKEKSLQNSMCQLRRKLDVLRETDAAYAEVHRQLLTVQDEWELFIRELEVKYPVYYKYKYENKVFSLGSVQVKLLLNHQSLIEYFTGDSSLYILLIAHRKNKLVKIPMGDHTRKVNELLALCADKSLLNRNYARYRTLAYELYQQLFQPLDIAKGRVVISPDEYFLPFDALLSDPRQETSFLVRDYAISYTYSAGFLFNKSHHHHPENIFLGIAPVTYQKHLGLDSLSGADLSLVKIKEHYTSASFLTRANANRKQFLSNLPLYSIVQLYSHADAGDGDKEPVLYLNDSAIALSEIQNISNIATDLMVLSACNSGVGKNIKGEGVFSLARGFSAAGIPSTVTTLWKIDNRETYALTELFYKYMSEGLPKDEALQQAKIDYLENNGKEHGLPYYWAANILIGTTSQIVESKTAHHYYLYAVIFLLSFISILVFRKAAYIKPLPAFTIHLFKYIWPDRKMG